MEFLPLKYILYLLYFLKFSCFRMFIRLLQNQKKYVFLILAYKFVTFDNNHRLFKSISVIEFDLFQKFDKVIKITLSSINYNFDYEILYSVSCDTIMKDLTVFYSFYMLLYNFSVNYSLKLPKKIIKNILDQFFIILSIACFQF